MHCNLLKVCVRRKHIIADYTELEYTKQHSGSCGKVGFIVYSTMLNDVNEYLENAVLDHIGIAVRNIDDAFTVYSTLDFRIEHRETIMDQGVEIAMIPVGDCNVELLQPCGNESPIAKFLFKRGPGIHHIAFRVKDIRDALKRLEDNGIGLLNQEPSLGAGGKLIAFLDPRSTNGVLIEICQQL